MKIVIVIPTYNEKDNVADMVPMLDSIFGEIKGHDFTALFVDDSSPDGTAEKVKELAEKYPFVQLLLRKEKTGLGAAYIDGFKFAMNALNADAVIEMDADFQHDPENIKDFVAALEEGYDYVIGSRFVEGGSIPENWAFYRKFLSVGGNIFSKFVLWIFDINDFTSGFKATRVKGFLDRIDFDSILSRGFAYKMDFLYKIYKLGARVKEVPIKFGERDRGDSKMERNNAIDSLRVVLTIRARESQNFIKFVVVGFIGLFVDTGLFNLLRITELTSGTSSLISGFIAMITTFLLNNFWSFSDRKIETWGKRLSGFMIYIISSYIPIVFRSWLISFATLQISDTVLVANGAFFVGVVIGLIWNFTVYSKIIWKKTNA